MNTATKEKQPRYTLGAPIIPIDNGSDKFLRHIGLPQEYVCINDQLVRVGVLKTGELYDLIGLSQHGALISAGLQDPCDHIDDEVTIDALYFDARNGGWISIVDVTVYTENFRFDYARDQATGEPLNHRIQTFDQTITLPVSYDDVEYHVTFLVSGALQMDFGQVKVEARATAVHKKGVTDTMTAAQLSELLAHFNHISPVRGYKLGAYRGNVNLASE